MYYFVHIPKAGGSTLGNHFFNAFGKNNCLCVYPNSQIKDMHPSEFQNLSASYFENIKSIQGHITVKAFLRNDHMKSLFIRGGVTILASIRDPIDRLVSLRNYISIHKHHPKYGLVNSIQPQDFILKFVDNYQSKYLSPTNLEIDLEFIKMFVKTYPIEHSERLFRKHLEFGLNEDLPQVEIKNITKSKVKDGHAFFSVDDITSSALEVLKERHSIDMDLYQNSLDFWQ